MTPLSQIAQVRGGATLDFYATDMTELEACPRTTCLHSSPGGLDPGRLAEANA